ncbi:hypothetical protein C9F11_37530 [Streptomyces sp. YIM 121038]|nr:hypothetical protein C9F11_37530 [Streptomyces sp. YIM 121038]
MTTPCPNPTCHSTRRPHQYLCWTCWNQLPAPALRSLSRRDPGATARVRQLHRQLERRVPLSEIEVSP